METTLPALAERVDWICNAAQQVIPESLAAALAIALQQLAPHEFLLNHITWAAFGRHQSTAEAVIGFWPSAEKTN